MPCDESCVGEEYGATAGDVGVRNWRWRRLDRKRFLFQSIGGLDPPATLLAMLDLDQYPWQRSNDSRPLDLEDLSLVDHAPSWYTWRRL